MEVLKCPYEKNKRVICTNVQPVLKDWIGTLSYMEINRVKFLGFCGYPKLTEEIDIKSFCGFIGSLSQLSMLNISGSNLGSLKS